MHAYTFTSNNFLLSLFYGISSALLCTKIVYLPAALLFAFLVAVLNLTLVGTTEVILYVFVGLLYGFALSLYGAAGKLLPDNFYRDYHMFLPYLIELLFLLPVFWSVDDVEEASGYPSGIAVSFLLYTGWFIVTYNVNYRLQKVEKYYDPLRLQFMQTYYVWFSSLLPFYLGALVPLQFNVFRALFGLVFAFAWLISLPELLQRWYS